MTKNEITQKLSELKTQKANIEGTKCEVYSRVVGYLRPVTLWNEGKKEEFKIRKHYCPCK
ncbi:MAG: anaerobic ribonucleoside-triphosphate reductase [Endomicrobium sp.]|jgi:anaerobic ribonucleoside-triphosphate reductase|nr:anaerobic ribonucleoside-triphosphate reductase [Endomicrobium sp.]